MVNGLGRVALYQIVWLIVWVVYLSFTVCGSFVGSCISLSQCVVHWLGRVSLYQSVWLIVWVVYVSLFHSVWLIVWVANVTHFHSVWLIVWVVRHSFTVCDTVDDFLSFS